MNKNIDLNDIDFNNMGSWPMPAKAVAVLVVFVVTFFLGDKLFIDSIKRKLRNEHQQESRLKTNLAKKIRENKQLLFFKDNIKKSKQLFAEHLSQLPSVNALPELLEDISRQAVEAGLEYRRIKPIDAVSKGFYMEMPINLVLIGSYDGFGKFFSALTNLSRIVTVHDFVISQDTQNNQLVMDLVIKSYWIPATKTAQRQT